MYMLCVMGLFSVSSLGGKYSVSTRRQLKRILPIVVKFDVQNVVSIVSIYAYSAIDRVWMYNRFKICSLFCIYLQGHLSLAVSPFTRNPPSLRKVTYRSATCICAGGMWTENDHRLPSNAGEDSSKHLLEGIFLQDEKKDPSSGCDKVWWGTSSRKEVIMS